MNNFEHNLYKTIIDKAESGDPAAMFELATLYDSNAISSNSEDEYINWLIRFLESDRVSSIIEELDDEEGELTNDNFDFINAYQFYPKIIEAGIALGLYFKNSSSINEVRLSCRAFYYAYLTSRFDYIEIDDEGGTTDILSLLSQAKERLIMLSGGTE